jgi:hypothetical protein
MSVHHQRASASATGGLQHGRKDKLCAALAVGAGRLRGEDLSGRVGSGGGAALRRGGWGADLQGVTVVARGGRLDTPLGRGYADRRDQLPGAPT